MRVTNTDPEDLRRYLLGQLPEEEAERMEARLLEDAELGELAESVEEDLLVEHFRGELPEGRDLVLRLSASAAGRQRVEFARALAQTLPKPRLIRRHWAVPTAIAAALVGAVIGLGIYHQTNPQPSQPVQAKAPVSRGVELPPAVLNLALITLRGEGQSLQPFDLGPEQTRAEIHIPNPEPFPSYQVSLTREDGSQVPHTWKVAPGYLAIFVRAADLPAGVYGVEVHGVPSHGELEPLVNTEFRVVRNAKSK